MTISLEVPYYSQRDNKLEPHRTCNVSSHAMACEFIKPGSFNGSDDEYYRQLTTFGDTTEHSAHNGLLKARGFKSRWETTLEYRDLDQSLYGRGLPVVIGVLHKGYYQTPYGGHMIVVVGKDVDGNYLIHDPWGEPFAYHSTNGKCCTVPTQSLDHRWLCDGPKTGWGRLFYTS